MSLSLFIGGVIFHTVELDSKSIVGERGVDSSRTRISLLKKKKKLWFSTYNCLYLFKAELPTDV